MQDLLFAHVIVLRRPFRSRFTENLVVTAKLISGFLRTFELNIKLDLLFIGETMKPEV